jgi:hypothetical protein
MNFASHVWSRITRRKQVIRKRQSPDLSKPAGRAEELEVRQVLSAVGLHIGHLSTEGEAQHSATHNLTSFTGTWDVNVTGNSSQTYTLHLSQVGQKVTGDIVIGSTQRSVVGTVHGNHLTLTLGPTPLGNPITIVGGSLHVKMDQTGHFQGKFQIQGEAMRPQTLPVQGTLEIATPT